MYKLLFYSSLLVAGILGCASSLSFLSIEHGYITEVFNVNGSPVLYYELHLRNVCPQTVSINKVVISDVEDPTFIYELDGEALVSSVSSATENSSAGKVISNPGDSLVIFLEVPLPRGKSTFTLTNQVEFTTEGNSSVESVSLTLPSVSKTITTISSPVTYGPWTAVNAPLWPRGHRRVFYPDRSESHLPGRFAIDFIRMDSIGRYASSEIDSVKNWYSYGEPVLAVADGIVATVNNSFKESELISTHTSNAGESGTGNYISIDIGHGQFAFFEHLQPGSILVKEGQKVRSGERIAAVGFTGDTTGPHLHFHLANQNSPVAEGIAFQFDQFTLVGSYPDFESFGQRLWIRNTGKNKMILERPGPNTVIMF